MESGFIQSAGAFSFGLIIGWYVYYVNRYRKGDVQFSDITTLLGVIGGGSILSLFKIPDLFGWYGVGLAVGFFGYFLVLVSLVNKSSNFDADWFLDGRRQNPPSGFGYAQDTAPTIRPMLTDSVTSAQGGVQNFYIDSTKVEPENITLTSDFLPAFARTGNERVAEAKRLLAAGKTYPKGCSEFVCAVLGVSYQTANELMGSNPTSLGSKPPYNDLTPGDIAGWVNEGGMGHVTVYIGESDSAVFIDVREPGAKPRSKNGFYDREIFKSSNY